MYSNARSQRFVSLLTRDTLALVLAGSRGTRLGALTDHRVKPAVPSVERSTLLVDSVMKGDVVRDVRGPGTLVPEQIRNRPKQPYRSPDARALAAPRTQDAFAEALGEAQVAEAGIFEPAGVARLWRKCRAAAARGRMISAGATTHRCDGRTGGQRF